MTAQFPFRDDREKEACSIAYAPVSWNDADAKRTGYRGSRQARLSGLIVTGFVYTGLIALILLTPRMTVQTVQTKPLAVFEVANLTPPPPPPPQAPKPSAKSQAPRTPIVTARSLTPVPVPVPVPVLEIETVERPPPPAPVQTPPAPALPLASAILEDGNLASSMLSAPAPRYPIESRRKREQGVVVLMVLLGTDGRVMALSIHRSSSHERLDDAALNAVRRWRWSPKQVDGVAVQVRGLVQIPFVLREQPDTDLNNVRS